MRIHHLALRTRDPERLAAFYEAALGLSRVDDPRARGIWLRAGDAVVMVERAADDEPAVPPGTKELVAFAASPGELPAAEARLAQAGVPVEERTAFTIYARDPDGRRVAVSAFAFGLPG